MLDKIFSYGWEPVLIQRILIGFEWIREKYINLKKKNETRLSKVTSILSYWQKMTMKIILQNITNELLSIKYWEN